MRRRGLILISAGIVLSVLTGVLVFRLLSRPVLTPGESTAVPTTTGETVPVPAAARPLSAGTTITTTDLVQREYPAALLPVGIVTDTNTIVGQVLSEELQQGEFFRPALLRGTTARLSQELDPDKVAIAFPLDPLLQQSGAINEGDHVDLLLTLEINETLPEGTRVGRSTSITLQKIKVLRVVREPSLLPNPLAPALGLVLEMSPQDAVIAKHVKDSGGVIDLALRSPQETQPVVAESINQDYLLDRYRFRAPVSGSIPAQQ